MLLSESIVALILEKIGYKPITKLISGNSQFCSIKIEVKCYLSYCPSSFGLNKN